MALFVRVQYGRFALPEREFSMHIVPYQESYFASMVNFIAHLNSDDTHHIGYFGTHPVDIEHTLRELTPPLEAGFMLAFDAETLVGILGLELDAEINRAWLYGPLIDHVDWHPVADQLYHAVQTLIPPTIGQYEIFCEAQNVNCQQFAERHQFKSVGEHLTFFLPHTDLIPVAAAGDWNPRFFAAFNALHQATFPRTYYTAQQMIDLQSDHARLFIDTVGDDLRGYIFVQVDPDAGEGYIDFIGVDERYRRQGIGKRLLAAALHWMFSFPTIEKVELTVNATNTAAARLYDGFGFQRGNRMCAFRTESQTGA
jgi:RimJ/RimL family protein N-acetyltransferase